jgi:hypothetical protein
MSRSIAVLVALSGLAAGVSAGVPVTVSPLVMAGDSYAGFTIATGFASAEAAAINNAGVWRIETDTTNPDTDADGLVLTGTGTTLPGTVLLTEGQPIAGPAGALLNTFDAITINNNGNSGYNFFLSGVTPPANDSGVYYNTTPVIIENDIATAAGLSAGTPYVGFFHAYINDDEQLLVIASVDDPAIATTVDRAVIRIDDPAGAGTETLLLREGSEVFTGRFVTDVTTGPHNTGFADGGKAILVARGRSVAGRPPDLGEPCERAGRCQRDRRVGDAGHAQHPHDR